MTLITKFQDCQTNDEVNHVVWDNIDLLNDNPRLYSFARNARRRINRIKRERVKSFGELMN
jgi:hypothetical protein